MQAAVAKKADKISDVDIIGRKYGHNCKATVQINGIPHLVYCIQFWPSSLKSRYIRNGRHTKMRAKIIQS